MGFFKRKPRLQIVPKVTILRILTFIIGITLYAVAFNTFFYPFKIVVGGLTGISIMVNHFLGVTPSLFILIASLALLIIAFIFLKKEQAMVYILGSLMLPLFIQLTSPLSRLDFLVGADVFIVVIFGGLISGLGTGLIFKTGFLTGESDILSQILARYTKITTNRAAFYIGAVIVVAGGVITTSGIYDFTRVMYAIVALYISTTLSEKVIIGISSNKTFYIFTDQVGPVREYITTAFSTSITIMKATGGYSGQRESVIMCVIPTRDYFKIREGLKLIDPDAFFVATDAYETTINKLKKIEE